MHILIDNVFWMMFNGFLAVLPVFLGWFFLKAKNKYLKTVLFFIWLVYLPNSIYLFTDLIHLYRQWFRIDDADKALLVVQYITLILVGLVTYLLALTPFERFLFTSKWKKEKKLNYALIILLNFLIGFGIMLGRTERINSWDVLHSPMKVVDAVFHILGSIELLFLVVLFGLFANFVYFLFRKPFLKFTQRIDK